MSRRRYTLDSRTHTLAQWALEYGIGIQLVWQRLRVLGWPLRRALQQPRRSVLLEARAKPVCLTCGKSAGGKYCSKRCIPLRTVLKTHRYKGSKAEHRLIAERALGHSLPKGAQVHHFSGVKYHNQHRNLVICQDAAYHALLHRRARIKRAGGNPNTDVICSYCRTLQRPIDKPRVRGRRVWCRPCQRRLAKRYYARKRARLEQANV